VTTQPSLTPAAFAAKWHGVTATEKAGSQEHFIDLCRMLGEPTPHEADPIGAQYAFEKRVSKAARGGIGVGDQNWYQVRRVAPPTSRVNETAPIPVELLVAHRATPSPSSCRP